METIQVKQLDSLHYEVKINAPTPTIHRVTVNPDYGQKISNGKIPVEKLITLSFQFLLEREPNTSILRQFDLAVIERYFPEYPNIMRGLLI